MGSRRWHTAGVLVAFTASCFRDNFIFNDDLFYARDAATDARESEPADATVLFDVTDVLADGTIVVDHAGDDIGADSPVDGFEHDTGTDSSPDGTDVDRPDVSVPAPRPLAPLSTAHVTSRRPRLRWALTTETVGARVELCRDRACTSSITTLDVMGTSTIPTTDLPSGTVFWRLRGRAAKLVGTAVSPTWQFTVGARSALVGTSWGTVPDFNGDGYADVAIVAQRSTLPRTSALDVYPGAAPGVVSSSAITLSMPLAPDLSASVASVGDGDGDGYGDVIVGGVVMNAAVFLGGVTGLSRSETVTLSPPTGGVGFVNPAVTAAGDLNGDGYGDVLVGYGRTDVVQIHHGGPSGPSPTPTTTLTGTASSRFGASVAGSGDVNGDGFHDVIVGTGTTDSVYVYLGNASGLTPAASAHLDGPAGSNFGFTLALLGDVNGDGFSDVLIGAPTRDSVYVALGGPGGLTLSSAILLGTSGSGFGRVLASAGDLNGDGLSDAFVGGDGQCFVYLGNTSPLLFAAPITLTGATGSHFGTAGAGAGDINRDGYGDLVVGAHGANSVFVYHGHVAGLSTSPTMLVGPLDSGFGFAVASRLFPGVASWTEWWRSSRPPRDVRAWLLTLREHSIGTARM